MVLRLTTGTLRLIELDLNVDIPFALQIRFYDWLWYSQGSILSPSGVSRPFDASADGCAILSSSIHLL